MIYLDHAATSLHRPKEVEDAIVWAIRHLGNPGRGIYHPSLEASRMVFDTRCLISDFFGGDGAEQVVFTKNATESLNVVIHGIAQQGDHVITTVLEHNSVLRPLYMAEKKGVEVSIVPMNKHNTISDQDFKCYIKQNTKAIICTHMSNVLGTIIDIKKIGQLCKEAGILLVVDVSQSAGLLPIHMKEYNIDALCFTGHKGLLGPQGTGGIVLKKGIKLSPFIVGGSGIHSFSKDHPSYMPTLLEAGTLNVHGIMGLRAGIHYIQTIGLEQIEKDWKRMQLYVHDSIKEIQGVTVYSPRQAGPIISFTIGEYDSGAIADELYETYGICVRAGSHCAPLVHEYYHTKQQGMVRVSVSHFNTMEEMEIVVSAIKEIVANE